MSPPTASQLVGADLARQPAARPAARISSSSSTRRHPHGSIGHITAACYSPALGKYIALALVKGGKARHGTRAFVSDPLRKRFGPVEIVSHHFFDPEGSRMHG